ncbi:MAG: CRISPR-associated endonuclease Cas3'' [Chloroflexi bacterium]|nr:CRISPR-associated endonuclease Cas3'' [Chloroflexota bacterium]
MERKVYYAHTNEQSEEQWQRLIDHLRNTAELARQLGASAGVGELAYTAALVHDLGKYSNAFQARLRGATQGVDHSTAGAKVLIEKYQDAQQSALAYMMAYCIAGHHTGLPNYGSATDLAGEATLCSRLKGKVQDYSDFQTDLQLEEIQLPLKLPGFRPNPEAFGFSFAFLTRMVYSALVDADFLETETFMRGSVARGEFESIPVLCERLNAYLERFASPKRDIDRVRTDILRACIAGAERPQGFFTLTVPTGGGKTLSSLAFALNHAVRYKLDRVIYVIPYTTIIEQNDFCQGGK